MAKWCTERKNHAVVVTAAERAAGRLSSESVDKALASCRKCGFAKLVDAIDRAVVGDLSKKAVAYARAHPNSPMLLKQIASTVEGDIKEQKSVWDGGRGRVAMVVRLSLARSRACVRSRSLRRMKWKESAC
jgi:hypothetical protein